MHGGRLRLTSPRIVASVACLLVLIVGVRLLIPTGTEAPKASVSGDSTPAPSETATATHADATDARHATPLAPELDEVEAAMDIAAVSGELRVLLPWETADGVNFPEDLTCHVVPSDPNSSHPVVFAKFAGQLEARLTGFQPGPHAVELRAGGRAVWSRALELDDQPKPLEIPEGELHGWKVVVRDLARTPASGAIVLLSGFSVEKQSLRSRVRFEVDSSADGTVSFGALPPDLVWSPMVTGSYRLDGDPPILAFESPGLRHVELDAVPAQSLSGTVLDGFGEPLANCLVMHRTPSGGSGSSLTDAFGHFMIQSRDTPNLVYTRHASLANVAISPPEASGGRLAPFTLTDGAHLEGVLTDADGAPLQGFQLQATPLLPDGQEIPELAVLGSTRRDGAFSFGPFAATQVRLAPVPRWAPPIVLPVAPGQTVVWPRPGLIEIDLTLTNVDSGKGRSGPFRYWLGNDEMTFGAYPGLADEDGSARITLPFYSKHELFKLIIDQPGYEVVGIADVFAGGTERVSQARPLPHLHVTVLDGTGRPLEDLPLATSFRESSATPEVRHRGLLHDPLLSTQRRRIMTAVTDETGAALVPLERAPDVLIYVTALTRYPSVVQLDTVTELHAVTVAFRDIHTLTRLENRQ